MPASLRVTACAAVLLLTSVSVATPSGADAGQAATVDDVIAKNLAARGGAEKLRSLNSVKITGIVTAQGMEQTLRGYREALGKRP